jgi:hypothetical protein
MTHPDTLTGADVFDVPDESLSPSDPAELVAWLRALPAGAILIDKSGNAWQLRQTSGDQAYIRCVAGQKGYYLSDDYGMNEMAEWAPYRLVWSSSGGR